MTIRLKDQDWRKKELKLDHISPEIIVENLPRTAFNVLDYLISFNAKYPTIYPAHDTMAKALKCSRRTIIRSIQLLKNYNFIDTYYRHEDSCLYKVSNDLYTPFNFLKLQKYFKSLTVKMGMLLFASVGAFREVKCHTINSRLIRNNYIYLNNRPRKLEIMSEMLSPVLNHFKERGLNLSLAGKICLSAFEDDTLQYVFRAFCVARNIRDPYQWVYALCLKHYEYKEKEPDFNLVKELLAMNGLSKDYPKVILPKEQYAALKIAKNPPASPGHGMPLPPKPKKGIAKPSRLSEDPELTKIKLTAYLETEAGKKALESGFFPTSLLKDPKPIESIPQADKPNPSLVNHFLRLIPNRVNSSDLKGDRSCSKPNTMSLKESPYLPHESESTQPECGKLNNNINGNFQENLDFNTMMNPSLKAPSFLM